MGTAIKRAKTLLSWTIAGAGILSVAALIIFAVSGAKFVTILTPSMTASGMPTGTGVVIMPIDGPAIRSGDVIFATSPFGDPVLHEAQGEAAVDGAGRLQLTMKGTSNPARDAYSYDVTDGAHKAIWSAPGLGASVQELWRPIPGTQDSIPAFAGVPWITIPLFLLLFWAFWPRKHSATQDESKSAHELEATAN